MISSIAIFSLIILIISVVIHEVSHGYAAFMQGDSTAYYQGRLTLNPLKHIDPFGSVIVPIVLYILSNGMFVFGWAKPVPFNPYNLKNQRWGELLVAIAGPISNILIAIIFGILIRLNGMGLGNPFVQLSSLVVLVNLGLAIFNMIPIPPLDGSKVLFSLLPQRFQQHRVTLERFSFLIIMVIVFIPAFSTILGHAVGASYQLITGIPSALIGF